MCMAKKILRHMSVQENTETEVAGKETIKKDIMFLGRKTEKFD